jgi:hypothetical protein
VKSEILEMSTYSTQIASRLFYIRFGPYTAASLSLIVENKDNPSAN